MAPFQFTRCLLLAVRCECVTYLFDGRKSTPLSQLSPDAWQPHDDDGVSQPLLAHRAYQYVPYIFRAIDIVGQWTVSVPYRIETLNGRDISETPDVADLKHRIDALLYLFATGTHLTGAAYAELAVNQFGKNLTPLWCASGSIAPLVDPARGVYAFARNGGRGGTFDVDNFLYVWRPNPYQDVHTYPGPAPVAAALAAAGLLYNLDQFATLFFKRGAIKASLLTVEGNPSPKDRENLKLLWQRVIAGIRNAFSAEVVSSSVKPVIVGEGLEQLKIAEISQTRREDICTAIGVPMSLMFSSALAGGTVQAEQENFLIGKIVPELYSLYIPAFNQQWLRQIGYRLVIAEDEHPVMQSRELARAKSLMELVGSPILTVDEARAKLGLEPMPQSPPPSPTPQALPEPPQEETEVEEDSKSPPLAPVKALDDLAKWQTKVIKRAKERKEVAVSFDSDHLPPEMTERLLYALKNAGIQDVKHIFAELKAFRLSDLNPMERGLYDAVLAILTKYRTPTAKKILAGEAIELSALEKELKTALIPLLAQSVWATVDAIEIVGIDPSDFNPTQWAVDYATIRAKQLSETTVKQLLPIAQAAKNSPMTLAQIDQMIDRLFGSYRAGVIAITEATTAGNVATKHYQAHLAARGIPTRRVWNTAHDERVCPICGPLDGKTDEDWGERFPNGAPAHPRCRCNTAIEVLL